MKTPRHYSAAMVIVAITGLAACTEPETGDRNGEQLFLKYCASCHKSSGGGNFLKGVPSAKHTRLTEKQILQLIYYGRPHSQMPTFPTLKLSEAKLIAGYVSNQLRRH
ncbi:cytochrome c [Neptunomonas sp. XY-337]|uniref:c-type cytochrome n=1 Tax=Neptunomonas sp. XY-337 TaxID=2561897 RepID=UPI0010AAD718|nr:cytochrome c [Neptunomonas sp. XY-337]